MYQRLASTRLCMPTSPLADEANAAAPSRTQHEALPLDELRLEVRTKPGEAPFQVRVPSIETVGYLKQIVAGARQGWATTGMNLISQGRFLDDEELVANTGLQSGDFVVVTGQIPYVINAPDEADQHAECPVQRNAPETTRIHRD